MRIIINSANNEYIETFSIENLDNIHKNFYKFSSFKVSLEAKIFAINELINSHQLLKLKSIFKQINFCSLSIYSNNRHTVLAGKSLKIDSTFIKEIEIKRKLFLFDSKKKDDILHEGTVR